MALSDALYDAYDFIGHYVSPDYPPGLCEEVAFVQAVIENLRLKLDQAHLGKEVHPTTRLTFDSVEPAVAALLREQIERRAAEFADAAA
jgi:hypothetical protein